MWGSVFLMEKWGEIRGKNRTLPMVGQCGIRYTADSINFTKEMNSYVNFSPAPHIERLPADQIDERYKALRRQVFLGTFIGYATFYLIRKNFNLAMPYMIQDYGYSKADLGIVLTMLSVAYGVSKFVMGNISDRSNLKCFATLGLLLSALVTLVFGVVPGVMTSIPIMCALSFMNGWFQGMATRRMQSRW